MSDENLKLPDLDFLAGGGELGALMRAHDWSGSPLGNPESWPQSLRSVVGLLLNSKFPMFVAWGDQLGFLYNDPYADILGAKHPRALGRPFQDIWAEIWPDISPLIDAAMAGEATYRENLPLLMNRKGFDEQTWFTFSYSPVRDENGGVAGMYCACTETTGQVLAERQLREGEARFRALVTASSDVVYRMSPDCTEMNEFDGREFIAGTNLPSVRWIDNYMFPEDRLHVMAVIEEAVRRKGVFELEHRVKRVDGTDGWTLSRAVPVLGAGGEIVEWFGMASDVTARKRAEDRLVEREERYRTLFGTIDEGFCIIEFIDGPHGPLSDYVHIEANLAYMANAGIPDIVGKRLREIVGDDEADAWVETYRRVLATGDSIRFERELLATERHLELAAFRVGPSIRRQVAVLFKDVSERKSAEARVRELNETLERRVAERTTERNRVWSGSRDILFVADMDGVFRDVNPAWTRVLGHAQADIVGRSFSDFVWPDDLTVTAEAISTAATGADIDGFENRHCAQDGTPRWISWHISFESDLIYGYGRDVTADRKHTAELALAQEALRQSQKMEAIGSLTGGVAHDFNNLLMAVLGNLEVLRRHVERDDRAVRLIDSAIEGAKRGASLTQRLLAFARRQELEVGTYDLVSLILGLTTLLRQSAGGGVELMVNTPPVPVLADVDGNQVELALLNLVVNARDAMPDGGTITINLGETESSASDPDLAPGRYIELSVTDTGKGMDPETLRRAVEPFFSTKGVGKGTGLGLSMIHGLMLQLGGALRLTSSPKEGTTARMIVPMADTQSLQVSASMMDTGTAVEKAARSRILVVDDDVLIAMSTVEMVADLGHDVIEANSGAAALEIIRAGAHIDLMITDFSMPKMTGAELIEEARSLRPGLRVILASGYAELPGGTKLNVARLGKPYEQRQLAEQINIALAGKP